eukprot:m.269813 g.269813  ORF g.269813 m.269813 type:complete len:349 (-) comp44051_c0_seq1:107-1153(-)
MCKDDPQRKFSKELDRRLRKEHHAYLRQIKVLLLGTGESGKSTIIKQMKFLYLQGFVKEEERKEFEVLVYQNILRGMKTMLDAMEKLQISLENPALQDSAYDLLDLPVKSFVDVRPHKDVILKLWRDQGIQKVYEQRNKYQLSDSIKYFLDELEDRIGNAGYIPNTDDVFRVREPTTGIHESVFLLEKAVFRMLDVGGQRSERRKWIFCFEDITSVIFVASTSEYDQVMFEENEVNRMEESIALFEQLVNYELFAATSFILFLNKQDLLEAKVQKSHLADYFPSFEGPKKDYEAAKEFIKEMYLSRRPPKKDVFEHETIATDTQLIDKVMDSVKSTLVRLHLKEYLIY